MSREPSKPRVLIVDDDDLLARSVGRLATMQGFRSHLVATPAEALASEGEFEIAVVDLNLGDESGVDLAARLLEEGRVGRVVFHSGTEDAELIRRAMAVGPVVRKGPQGTSQLLALFSGEEGGE